MRTLNSVGGGGLGLLTRLWTKRHAPLIVVDGSNVLHWSGAAQAATVAAVVADLKGRGLRPVLWLDANAGYLVAGRHLRPAAFAGHLRLPARQVFAAPKGTPADRLILPAAALKAQVVTNDRYRDWVATYPVAAERDRLIRDDMTGQGGVPVIGRKSRGEPRSTGLRGFRRHSLQESAWCGSHPTAINKSHLKATASI